MCLWVCYLLLREDRERIFSPGGWIGLSSFLLMEARMCMRLVYRPSLLLTCSICMLSRSPAFPLSRTSISRKFSGMP